MPYQFAQENQDYSQYASGHVFYSAPGHPAFPVRLVSEVFQRCQALRHRAGLTHPAVLYDPCCGSAYHLSTLAYLHWTDMDTIIASDIDPGILSVAARNLSLLTPEGLEKRSQEIAGLLDRYGKSSHAAAFQSVQRFKQQLSEAAQTHQLNTQFFLADATSSQQMINGLNGRSIDILLADVPYGNRSKWQSSTFESLPSDASLLGPMLDALISILSSHTILAIVSDKAQKIIHPQYRRVGRFQVGKRLISLLQTA
jgi:23S rRNA G2445 N2-methylase RlmL